MSDRADLFRQYAAAVDALRPLPGFGAAGQARRSENAYQFTLLTRLPDVAWLSTDLPAVAAALAPAGFEINLTAQVADIRCRWQLRKRAGDWALTGHECETLADYRGDPVPPAVEAEFVDFQGVAGAGSAGPPLAEVAASLARLEAGGAPIDLALQVDLNKVPLIERLSPAGVGPEDSPVVCYLFADALANTLMAGTLADLEALLARPGRRTVVVGFDLDGLRAGPYLALCGRGAEDRLDELIAGPLPPELVQHTHALLRFRLSQQAWADPPAWLTPDFLALPGAPGLAPAELEIDRQLEGFRAVLSAAFMADSVEREDSGLAAEYRGLGRVTVPLDRASFLAQAADLTRLFDLYRYAYEGLSPDKLEIVQQFLSLLVVDVRTLCTKADDVGEAAQKTYGRVLTGRVKEYFDARHQVQEHVRGAVRDTAADVVKLTAETSADLYKIAGIVAAAFVGALLNPQLTLWAAMLASAVAAAYMGLVLRYHLPTVKQAYELRRQQSVAYIGGFRDVLTAREIDELMADEQLTGAARLYAQTADRAGRVYAFFLVLALLVAAGCIALLATGNTLSPIVVPARTP